MKLIRFVVGDSSKPHFGVAIGNRAVAFSILQGKTGKMHPELADSRGTSQNFRKASRRRKNCWPGEKSTLAN